MKNNFVGHGLIIPVITPDQYLLGALPQKVIQADGQWLPYLPAGEWQARKNFDTYGCTDYNTINALEILENKLWGIEKNYAERPPYIGLDITPPGANPHDVSEWIRKNGLCKEESLPFDDSITSLEIYRTPNPLSPKLVAEGKLWLAQYEYSHEWVMLPEHDLKEKQNRLMTALQYSSLGIAMQAWQIRDGLYFQDGQPNHWTVLIGFLKGEYWLCFDSYEPYIKKIEWDTDFQFAKRYYIAEIPPTQYDGCDSPAPAEDCAAISKQNFTFFARVKQGWREILKTT